MADDKKRILIIEDAEDIQATLLELLNEERYEVWAAPNGREALRMLDAAGELPAVILLDLMMPVMNGHQFRAAQLRDPRFSRIPVLLMSAGVDIQKRIDELGVQGCLKKPFADIDTILKTIADAM